MYQDVSQWHGIARHPCVSQTSSIRRSCVRFLAAGHEVNDAIVSEQIPEITDLDELQTFVGNKPGKLWIWTAVNHKQPIILAWVVEDRSAATFQDLWSIVKCWQCFWYVTDGWLVYPPFIEAAAPECQQDLHDAGRRRKHKA